LRVALLTLDRPDTIAGRALALHQFDFARAAGAGRVIAVGDGLARHTIALRHAVEQAGLRFQVLGSGRGLLGSVGTADEVLVIAPHLLPEAAEALAGLGYGAGILTLPATAATAAGFERIDPHVAWGGVLLMPGGLIERLDDLPADFAAAPALLRIALQGQVPLRALPPALLDDGSWVEVRSDTLPAVEAAWLKRHMPAPPKGALGQCFAGLVMGRWGSRLLTEGRARMLLLLASLVLLATGIGLATSGLPIGALVSIGFASLPAALWHVLGIVRRRPLGGVPSRIERFVARALPWLIDGALACALAMNLPGNTARQTFAPAVLVIALNLARPSRWPLPLAWLTDRLALCVILAVAAGFDLLAPAAMVLALALLALELALRGPELAEDRS
jgi:hypothetical protein